MDAQIRPIAPPSMDKRHVRAVRQDLIAGTVVFAAIALFVTTGSTILSDAIAILLGEKTQDNNVLAAAFLLNIALILFGWRRFRDLSAEIADRTLAEQRALILAETDPLTGFYNRRANTAKATDLQMQAHKDEKAVACLLIDLDNFKMINDVHGHDAGDIVLREVAKRIEKIIPKPNVLARLGGDEFCCIFPFGPGDRDKVDEICEMLAEAITLPIVKNGNHLITTASIGISAQEEGEYDSVDLLMRSADIAMYRAKKQGRNGHCWFNVSMQTELQARNLLELGMRDGIPRGEFVPYFEPQHDLQSGQLVGFEMLTRWHSPLQGIVSPEIFIPLAEETGMISELSMNAMQLAIDAAMRWDDRLMLSVNISPVQLADPWLAQKIVKMLVERNFPAKRLEIEITESSLFDNLLLAKSTISSLKNQGVQIALDDFGTGYSSLSHLRALPFDRIKIDRSFVSTMTQSKDSEVIVRSVAGLGAALGIPITAEGVEDQEILDMLREIGCAKGQGWHFGKPIDAVRTEKLLAELGLLKPSADAGAAIDSGAADDHGVTEDAKRMAGSHG